MFTHHLLHDCNSTVEVESALHALCGIFGDIQKLEVISAPVTLPSPQKCGWTNPSLSGGRSRRHAVCFLRMASGQEEEALLEHIGKDASQGRFGGDVVLLVAFNEASPGMA